jgi:hypothetical protein
MRWLKAGSSQGILLSSADSWMCRDEEIRVLISIMLSLAVIKLRANVIQPGGVDAVGLTVDGLDQFFGFEFFEGGKGAVGQQQPFAGVAFNGGDAARRIADVRDSATFGENV